MEEKSIYCPSCGAEQHGVSLSTPTMTCAYCGSTINNPHFQAMQANAPQEKRGVPFRLDDTSVKHSLAKSLAAQDHVPLDVYDYLTIVSVSRYRLPMWYFDGSVNAPWHCVERVQRERRRSNGSYEKYEEDVPHSGVASGNFGLLSRASVSLQLPKELEQLTSSLPYHSAYSSPTQKLDETNVSTGLAEIDETSAWNNPSIREWLEKYAKGLVDAQIPTTRQLSWSWTCNHTNGELLSLPFYSIKYKYKDQQYEYAVDGCDANTKMSHPIDEGSVAKAKSLLLQRNLCWVWGIIGFLFGIIGAVVFGWRPTAFIIGGCLIAFAVIFAIVMNSKYKALFANAKAAREQSCRAFIQQCR